MIGFFIVQSFGNDKDLQGFSTSASVLSEMDSRIAGTLFLPPYLRTSQCDIKSGSKVFGVMDDTTGFGVAMYGENDADFGYFFDADIVVKKSLNVDDTITSKKDIISTLGDVKTTTASLNDHKHSYVGLPDGAPGTTTSPIVDL